MKAHFSAGRDAESGDEVAIKLEHYRVRPVVTLKKKRLSIGLSPENLASPRCIGSVNKITTDAGRERAHSNASKYAPKFLPTLTLLRSPIFKSISKVFLLRDGKKTPPKAGCTVSVSQASGRDGRRSRRGSRREPGEIPARRAGTRHGPCRSRSRRTTPAPCRH